MSITPLRSVLLPLLALLGACAGPSGPVRTETRTVENFHAIDLRGAADAEIVAGKATSLTVTSDDETLRNLQTQVRDGVLVIQTDKSRGSWFQRRATVKLQIETPSLDSLILNGAGDFRLRDVMGDKLKVVMAGAGSISATGQVTALQARIDGAGGMDLRKLTTGDAEVSVNGAGSLEVCATGNLNAEVNGVGSITYSCNPQKAATSVHGVGSIHPAGGRSP
jgi:hypothetical protein